MRLDVKNASSHQDAPTGAIANAVGVQLLHLANRWAGASRVIRDLNDQGFYLALVNALPEAPGALGYHYVDSEGRPYSRIGVDLSLTHGSDWLTGKYSVVSVVGHEALETVCNPIVNIWRDIDQNTETAQEACDAVEDTQYRYNGCDLTNFLLPSYFNPFGKAPFDYLGVLHAPFSMTAGGYQIVRTGGQVSQRFGVQMPEWRAAAHVRAHQLGA